MNKLKNLASKHFVPIVLLIVLVLVGLICPPILYLNDDIIMRSILSGAYTGIPNGHAVYMQYPLTAILALLYWIVPIISWMEVFFAACIWCCMILVAKELPHAGAGAYLVLLLFLPFYVFMHYTIVAALVGGTAVFLVCRSKHSIPSIVLLWIAFMIRSEVGLLCLPFAAAGLVWRILRTKETLKKDFRVIIRYVGILVLGLVLTAGINALFYSSTEWREYLAYNESRTALYDYTNFQTAQKFRENHEAYKMTEEEAQILTKYYTMLDSSIDSDKLEEVEKVVTAGMWEGMDSFDILKNCIKKYYVQITQQNVPYNYVWLLFYVCLAIAIVLTRRWLELIVLGAVGAGRSFIWLYLLGQDRFPERVVLALYVIEILLLLSMSISKIKDIRTEFFEDRPKVQTACIIAVAILGGAIGGYLVSDNCKEAYAFHTSQEEWQDLKEYCSQKEDMTYFLDVTSLVNCVEADYSSEQSNMMMIGGWLTASPLANERLEALGGEDAAEVLYSNDNARLLADISQDMSWLQEYMQNRFGDCELVISNTIFSGYRAIIEYEVKVN